MSLFIVLHKQLGPEVSAMLKGAAAFIVIYAGLVHFEPFVSEWRSGKGVAAAALYFCVAAAAAVAGVEIAVLVLEPSFTLPSVEFALLVIFLPGLGLALYRRL